jgi:hypothetical protein
VTHLFIPGRPVTLNVERQGNRWARSKATAPVRQAAALMAARMPPIEGPVEVISWPTYPDRRSWPDTGGTAPTAKAAIDGLVDAGVILEDGPKVVRRLVFLAPEKGPLGLHVVLRALPSPEGADDPLRAIQAEVASRPHGPQVVT